MRLFARFELAAKNTNEPYNLLHHPIVKPSHLSVTVDFQLH